MKPENRDENAEQPLGINDPYITDQIGRVIHYLGKASLRADYLLTQTKINPDSQKSQDTSEKMARLNDIFSKIQTLIDQI